MEQKYSKVIKGKQLNPNSKKIFLKVFDRFTFFVLFVRYKTQDMKLFPVRTVYNCT